MNSRSSVWGYASGHATTLSPSDDFNLDPRPQFPAEPKEREGNVLTAERAFPVTTPVFLMATLHNGDEMHLLISRANCQRFEQVSHSA